MTSKLVQLLAGLVLLALLVRLLAELLWPALLLPATLDEHGDDVLPEDENRT